MVSHSYGACVTFSFLTWVEKQEPGWVDNHVESWVNVAGPILGLPKAFAPLISGGFGGLLGIAI
jgi:phospholipid:diacylglycerol acyltransferase